MKLLSLGGKYGKEHKALVDDQDFDSISPYNWSITKNRNGLYVIAWIKGKRTYLHRFIMKAEKNEIIDHINGNPLDNRRSNLRFCTNAENLRNRGLPSSNTSGFKGIYWHKKAKKWSAEVVFEGKKNYLGLFVNIEDAANAYKLKAKELYGDFYQEAA